MIQRFAILLILIILFIFFGCEESQKPEDNISIEIALGGAVQKGPFLNGTAVQVTELEQDLSPTGRNFSSQIENNAGLFTLPKITYSSQYVELQAEGYYYNEVTDAPSSSPITLYAISDITNRTTVNVNLISTLERPRVKVLLQEGYDYETAKDSAFKEVLTIFGFTSDEGTNSEDLDIISSGQNNAILLAISLILQGGRSEAELSELVSNISFDIRDDGMLTSANSTLELLRGAVAINPEEVRNHLETRYDELGLGPQIGDFESYLLSFQSEISTLDVVITKTVDCTGGNNSIINAAVSGGNPPYLVQWITEGVNGETLSDVGPGSYVVEVTDDYGQLFGPDTVRIPEAMDATWQVAHISQDNPAGSIDLSVWGGEPPYSFNWSDGSNQKNLTTNIDGPFTVTITDANSCTVDTTINIIDMQNILDIDGNQYSAIQIGDQIWLQQNLRVTHYQNGQPILNITDPVEWTNTQDGAYCVFENNTANSEIYGHLYNWHSISDEGNLSITGWHIPSLSEWDTLVDYLGGPNVAGGKLKETGLDHWLHTNTNVTNESYFTGLGAGQRDFNGGTYEMLGYRTSFWTNTSEFIGSAWTRQLISDYDGAFQTGYHYNAGLSIRLVLD